jgi:hypothetical protein
MKAEDLVEGKHYLVYADKKLEKAQHVFTLAGFDKHGDIYLFDANEVLSATKKDIKDRVFEVTLLWNLLYEK